MSKRDLSGDSFDPKKHVLGAVKITTKQAKFLLRIAEEFYFGNWTEAHRQLIEFSEDRESEVREFLAQKKKEQKSKYKDLL